MTTAKTFAVTVQGFRTEATFNVRSSNQQDARRVARQLAASDKRFFNSLRVTVSNVQRVA